MLQRLVRPSELLHHALLFSKRVVLYFIKSISGYITYKEKSVSFCRCLASLRVMTRCHSPSKLELLPPSSLFFFLYRKINKKVKRIGFDLPRSHPMCCWMSLCEPRLQENGIFKDTFHSDAPMPAPLCGSLRLQE